MMNKINANKIISRALSAVLSLSLILPLSSCTSDTPQETDALQQIEETLAVSEPGAEKRPTGEIDADAKNVVGIAISSAEELSKIGKDKKYPLDGDYVLVADIDYPTSVSSPRSEDLSANAVLSRATTFSPAHLTAGDTQFTP